MSVPPDPWHRLGQLTPARIALGRSGVSLPTARALELRAAHAAARTAVHAGLDAAVMAQALGEGFPAAAVVRSRAADRATYLQRPDLGRALDPADADRLAALRGDFDVAVIVGDGLSALAVERNAAPFLAAFRPHAARHGWRLAPLMVATQARVALSDAIGAALGARLALMLIGERPGLSSPDSLGLYLTHGPRPGLLDAARNCISNIREGGLAATVAAYRAAYLVDRALTLGFSGVALKDDTAADPQALEVSARPAVL
jgi:ethanolamine ammonia-lyase small subunit